MQTTNTIIMIRPANFGFNTETAESNSFQNPEAENDNHVQEKACDEFDVFVQKLRGKGVEVLVFEDTVTPLKPDAIFPNNWLSMHSDGTLILYPMQALNRRLERRIDIIEEIKRQFQVTKIHDLSYYEATDQFLEGTGSIVFDHRHKLAYACLSPRTDKKLLLELCELIGYRAVLFYSHDLSGKEIYHTNVMMCIGNEFAVICSESITDTNERSCVLESLTSTGHEIIEIDFDQMNSFAGNMLAVKGKGGELLVMSASSMECLTIDQKESLEKYVELLPQTIPTIETIGGGSARCMMGEVFLPRKN